MKVDRTISEKMGGTFLFVQSLAVGLTVSFVAAPLQQQSGYISFFIRKAVGLFPFSAAGRKNHRGNLLFTPHTAPLCKSGALPFNLLCWWLVEGAKRKAVVFASLTKGTYGQS
uniref:Uncharacterized protein n=1 Tax=Botryococcus braunii TaxID=38881 RepID=A0A0U2EZX9_BOTBR|nr:hypothetical protein [Botryococcus braunii]AKU37113.1 hypothetical protein [Botryococcus braunii]